MNMAIGKAEVLQGMRAIVDRVITIGVVLAAMQSASAQDRAKITFKDENVPTMPSEAQMALLREEVGTGG